MTTLPTPEQPLPAPSDPQPPRPSRTGVVALVLGIVALVLAFVPIGSFIAGFVAIAAVVVGILALRPAVTNGRGAGITGLILGIVALIAAIVMSVVYVAIFFVGAAVTNIQQQFPSGFPTDLSSYLPTDLPTDFPTDFPTDLPTPSDLGSAAPTGAAGSVVYRVTGDGTATTITYIAVDGSGLGQRQVSGVDLPWRRSVGIEDASGFANYSLVAQSAGSGEISCSIAINGDVVSTNTSSGDNAVVTCSATP